MSDTPALFAELLTAEKAIRRIHATLSGRADLLSVLEPAVRSALAEPESEERTACLVRSVNLLGEISGPVVVDLLIDVLGAEDPEIRQAAGTELEEACYEHWREVIEGVERALVRLPDGHAALPELPYVLAEVAEDGATKIVSKFLARKEPEVVASAIEAMATQGDPGAVSHLEKLKNDKRVVHLEDEEGNDGTATIGELAKDAIEMLKNAVH